MRCPGRSRSTSKLLRESAPSTPSSGPENTLARLTGATRTRRHGIATPPTAKLRSSTSLVCRVPPIPRICLWNSIRGGCAPIRWAAAGVKIVPSAPVSITRVTGTPLADRVTIGALRRVATVVSPNRTAPQPPAAAIRCSAAYSAVDRSKVVTITPPSHRVMRDQVTFGAALCKASNVTVLNIATWRACLRAPPAVSNLAIPHAGPRPLPPQAAAPVLVSSHCRSTDFPCGGPTGERIDYAHSCCQHAPAARSRCPLRPPYPTLEPEDGALHFRRPQRDSHHRPRTDRADAASGAAGDPRRRRRRRSGVAGWHQTPGPGADRRDRQALRPIPRQPPLARRHAD